MNKDIFEFDNYKLYLRHWIAQKPGKGRGFMTKIAQALHCQSGYVSQVLSGSAHFSAEQAEALNQFLGHNYEEGHFFHLLLSRARAGTGELKKRCEIEIERVLQQRLLFKDRVDIKKSLDISDQATYYSSWYFAAIHVAVSVPELRTKEALSKYFQLDMPVINEAVDFLISVGLLKKIGDEYSQGVTRLFLGKDSPMIRKHHTNWRIRSISSLDRGLDKDLHFSSVVSLSKKDTLLLKERFMKFIEEFRAIVRESKEEDVCCINVDLFSLKS